MSIYSPASFCIYLSRPWFKVSLFPRAPEQDERVFLGESPSTVHRARHTTTGPQNRSWKTRELVESVSLSPGASLKATVKEGQGLQGLCTPPSRLPRPNTIWRPGNDEPGSSSRGWMIVRVRSGWLELVCETVSVFYLLHTRTIAPCSSSRNSSL